MLFRIVVWRRAHGLECCVQRAQQTHTREGKKASNAVLFPPYPREVKTNTTKFKSAAILALACLYGNGATRSHAPASARAWLKHAHSFDGSWFLVLTKGARPLGTRMSLVWRRKNQLLTGSPHHRHHHHHHCQDKPYLKFSFWARDFYLNNREFLSRN